MRETGARPNLQFYIPRCTAERFPPGCRVTPELLKEKLDPDEWFREKEMWNSLDSSLPWAAEIYPDFPWMEAIAGCTVTSVNHGYLATLPPTEFPALTPSGKNGIPPYLSHWETPLSQNPWMRAFTDLWGKADQVKKQGFPVAIPPVTGPASVLSVFFNEGATASMEQALERLSRIYISFFDTIVALTPPSHVGFVSGGSFLTSPYPLIVLKDPLWFELLTEFPLDALFTRPLKAGLSCAIYLSTHTQYLRKAHPEQGFETIDGFLIEKDETSLPWEDLLPLLRIIQGAGKTLIIAGPPDVKDWELANQELTPEKLVVLFYVSSPKEAAFWTKHLLKSHSWKPPEKSISFSG